MVKGGLEVSVALIFFSFLLSSPITTNLLIYRSCYVILDYNKTDCALLGKGNESSDIQKLEKLVQPTANIISMVQSIIISLCTCFTCFFIGSYADVHGRKPALLTAIFGYTLYYIIVLIYCFLQNASPWWIILNTIPALVTGGFPTFFTLIFCFITDSSNENNRGIRMGIFECVFTIGGLIGTLASSYVFYAGGYVLVYGICSSCTFLSFLSVLFLVPESLARSNDDLTVLDKKIFKFELLKDTFRTFFKRRLNNDRLLLILLTLQLMILYLVNVCSGNLIFQYLREKFDWSLRNYNYYSASGLVISSLGSSLGIYVFQILLHVPEEILVIIGTVTMIFGSLTISLANENWVLYLGLCFGFFVGMLSPLNRSLISKIAGKDDVGKIFSVVSAVETFTGLWGSMFYTYIYNSTLDIYVGFYNFVSAGFLIVSASFAMVVLIVKRREREITYRAISD